MKSKKLTLILFVLSLFLVSSTSTSSEFDHQLHIRQIVLKLQPALSDTQAKKIANALYSVSRSKNCGISWDTLLSIAFTESALKKRSIGLLSSKTLDYGLMQINDSTANRLKLNRARLVFDEKYAIEAGCKILADNKKAYAKKRPYWIGAYRSGVNFSRPEILVNAIKYDSVIKSRIRKIKNISNEILKGARHG